jgi:hypothetical protein
MNARKSRARRANRILLAAPAALAGPLRTSLAPVLLAALLALSLAHASRAEAFVYWADGPQKPGSTIGRANLDGTGADRRFIRAGFGSPPSWVAVDAEHVYWGTIDGTIGRANLDGTGVDPSFIAGSGLPSGVAVDAAHIYWANGRIATPGPAGTIGRANLDGTGVAPSFITGPGNPCGVAVDAAHVYWKHGLKVGRANLDGTGVDRRFVGVQGGGSGACGVAVDALRSFSFGKAKKTTRNGKTRLTLKRWTARLTLKLPAPGKLELARTMSVKGAKKRAGAKGTVKLPVSPRGKAKHRLTIGSRCLRFLPRFRCSPNGIVGADVKAEVAYTPRGGDPSVVASTLNEQVRLVRRCRGC